MTFERRLLPFVLAALLVPPACSAAEAQHGKIIEWGWGTPPPAYVKEHIAEMEKLPFDGLGFDLKRNPPFAGDSGDFASWHVWSAMPIKPEDYSESIAALKTTHFTRFTENFLRLNVSPGNVDWFSDDFATVLQNARLLARVARDAGLKGILFDIEIYQSALWQYGAQKAVRDGDGKGFVEYQQQVRKCGARFIKALNEEYPDLTILLTFGTWISYKDGQPLQEARYGLLPSFLDGMLEAALPQTLIYDGGEQAYGFTDEEAFDRERRAMLEAGLKRTAVPDAFRQHYRASFGLWIDNDGKWDQRDFANNYFTPDEFAYSLHQALKHTDRYVWIYSQKARWWEGQVPQPYIDALTRAREVSLPMPPQRTRATQANAPMTPPDAHTYPGADDQSTFGDLWSDYREVLALPEQDWKFKLDPQRAGLKEKWFDPGVDDAVWPRIDIHQWWEPQGYAYDGAAWYRRMIDVPASASGQRLFLAFGAVDETAIVFVNGNKVGEHDEGDSGWKSRFLLDVTDQILPGKQNLVAVRVYDAAGYGGIWKSIKLITPNKPK